MKSNIIQNLRQRLNKGGKPDYVLMAVFGILIIFGLIVLFSASSIYSFKIYNNTYYVVIHQILVGLLPGLFLFFIFYKVDYRVWLRFNFLWFIFTILLLVSVFIPGLGTDLNKGVLSWVKVFGFSMQPSEIAKLTFLIFLAGWCYKKGRDKMADFSYGFIPFIFYLASIAGLVILEPDLGTALVIVVMSILIFFTAGAKISHLGWLGLAGAAGFTVLALEKTYLVKRLLVFLNPNVDPQGIGYQLNQALLAIGSGGFFGRGYGNSQQKFAYLPEVHGDSIFAVIAEELGFVAVVLLVTLFLIIMYRGFRIARGAPDEYGRLIAVGIVGWFIFQAFLNIAVVSGLAPLTGIPLPFISAGGTALAISLGAAGLLLNVSKQEKYV